MVDIKPVFKKENGKWVKKDAYEMKNREWVKISSAIPDDITLSYIGSSTRTEVSAELFSDLEIVTKENLYGTVTVTTTAPGWLWWITRSEISSISVDQFPVPYTEIDPAYSYNGVSYHCYRSDYEIVADTHEFTIA